MTKPFEVYVFNCVNEIDNSKCPSDVEVCCKITKSEQLQKDGGPSTPGVNFTNILWLLFCNKSVLHSFLLKTFWLSNFFGKRILVQKLLVNCWCFLLQVSISPTFCEQLFCTKVFGAAFMFLQFMFVMFLSNKYFF